MNELPNVNCIPGLSSVCEVNTNGIHDHEQEYSRAALDVLQRQPSNSDDLKRLEQWMNRFSSRKDNFEKFVQLFECIGNPKGYTISDRVELLGLLPVISRTYAEKEVVLPHVLQYIEPLKTAEMIQLRNFLKNLLIQMDIYEVHEGAEEFKIAVESIKKALDQAEIPQELLPELRKLIVKEMTWLQADIIIEVKYKHVFTHYVENFQK